MSNANKLLIRCAWAGTSAFASAGYGLSWGPGSCTCTPNPDVFCILSVDPVCGKNGMTYSNPCFAKAACQLDGSTPGSCT